MARTRTKAVMLAKVLWLLLGSSDAFGEDDKWTLRTAVFDGCPFICLDGSGVFLDVLRLALRETHYHLQFVDLPFERAKKFLAEGQIDLLPGIIKDGISPAFFPDTWLYPTQMCFYVLPDDGWAFGELSSLANRTLGIERGIVHSPEFYRYVEHLPSVFRLVGDGVLKRQLEMLLRRRVDTITAERTVLRLFLNEAGIASTELKNAGCFDPEFEYVAVSIHRSDSLALSEFLSKNLESVRSTTDYQRLTD